MSKVTVYGEPNNLKVKGLKRLKFVYIDGEFEYENDICYGTKRPEYGDQVNVVYNNKYGKETSGVGIATTGYDEGRIDTSGYMVIVPEKDLSERQLKSLEYLKK